MEATHYPRRVLLAVSGLSPQIVTETLYALSVNQDSPWIPTEIHLVTTQEGREIVRHSLLNPEHGYFYRLIEEYKLPDINFSIENVHVIQDKAGTALEDIRTEQDNQACADRMVGIVQRQEIKQKATRRSLLQFCEFSLVNLSRTAYSHVLSREQA